jgi:hypothetical protein
VSAAGNSGVSCDVFDDALEGLAVGTVAEPERTALLSHAASCPACEARLNELAALADRLLLLAPEVEPPAGFEAAVLARMGPQPVGAERPGAPSRRDRHPRRWLWAGAAAAAALAAVLLLSGVAVGRATRHAPAATQRSGALVTSAGDHVGEVGVSSRPVPYVLMSMYEAPGSGLLNCELETRQGRFVVVGSWDYRDLHGGVWAVGIDRSLTDAVMMRLRDGHGTVVATAALTAPGSHA